MILNKIKHLEEQILAKILQEDLETLFLSKEILNYEDFQYVEHQFVYHLLHNETLHQQLIESHPSPSCAVINYYELHGDKLLREFFQTEDIEELRWQIYLIIDALLESKLESGVDLQELCMNIQNCHDDVTEYEQYSIGDITSKYINEEQPTESIIYKTGIISIDEVIHGLEEGKLYVLGGEPGTGKSFLAQQIAYNLSKSGVPTAFISLEMSKKTIIKRMLTMIGIKDLTGATRDIAKNIESNLEDVPFFIFDKVYDIDTIKNKINLCAKYFGLKIVFIDYLQIIRTLVHYPTKTDEVNAILDELLQIAKELNVHVFLISSILIKNYEVKKGRKPTMADLKDSSKIAFDADGIMMLSKPIKDVDDYCEIIVEKLRDYHITKKIIPLEFDKELLLFREFVSVKTEKMLIDVKKYFK